MFPASSSQKMGAPWSADNLLFDLGQVPVYLWALHWRYRGQETWVVAGLATPSDAETTVPLVFYF